MNRLIIIGNGFDLAHGIESSFKDFIIEYLRDSINNFFQNGDYSDILLEIKFIPPYNHFSKQPELIKADKVLELVEQYKNHSSFRLRIKSKLLERAYSKIKDYNWVDLEVEFFNLLIETKKKFIDKKKIEEINNVNSQLEYLKRKLIVYLEKQESYFSNVFDKNLLTDCFCEPIKTSELITVKLKKNQLPENLYFLNFNYTNTFESYIDLCRERIPTNYNYIHGTVSGVNGNPIFGFGDELDKRYLEFEDEQNNELFKHIKSFEYLQSKNFYLLTSFLESNDFQVHIYGHSCGVSDRTMLNQIFEHENCKSIKIFYHKINEGKNDFVDKTYEISRHFKDKTMLRKKLVPLCFCREMPQPQNEYELNNVE